MEKDEGEFADFPVSLHHGLKMETLELYIVKGHIHKFSVYYGHFIDSNAHPRTSSYININGIV